MAQVSREVRQCEDTTAECLRVCTETLGYITQKGGRMLEGDHVQVLLDCIEACRGANDYMLRGSDLSDEACSLCAQACERCSKALEQFADDQQMRVCVDACRLCAETCRGVAVKAA